MLKYLIIFSLLLVNSISHEPTFLLDSSNPTTNPIHKEQLTLLVQSFFEGLEIFNGLPHEGSCDCNEIAKLLNDDLLEIFKAIALVKERSLPEGVLIIVKSLTNIYDKLNSIEGPCGDHLFEIRGVMSKVVLHLINPNTIIWVPLHALFKFEETIRLYNEMKENFVSPPYDIKKGGIAAGKLVHFVLFWEFNRDH
jgi:hypothetical protein